MSRPGRDAYLSDAAWAGATDGEPFAEDKLDLDLPPLRYLPGALLGRGGNASVRAGFDPVLLRHVALKRAHRSDLRARELLLREARLTARLDHPAIAEVLDLGIESDDVVVVLHVRHGRTLAEAVAGGLPAPTLLRALTQVSLAIAHAHQRGIIHRDLSPANVAIGEAGEVTVLDWGLAAELAEGEKGGVIGGTHGFASPELRIGAPTTPATDVWSLGALLHLICTGAPPLAELRRPPACDKRLWAIVHKALAAEPGLRYCDAGDLAADLEAFLDGQAIRAYAERPWDRLLRQIKRRPAAAVAFSTALIVTSLAVGLGGVLAARSESRARQAEDLARAARSARLVDAAERTLAMDDVATARGLAVEAEAGPEKLRARGVLAAVERAQPLDLLAEPSPCGGAEVVDSFGAAGPAVCRTPEAVELRAGAGRHALPVGTTSVAVLGGARVWVGAVEGPGPVLLAGRETKAGGWQFSSTGLTGGPPSLRASPSRRYGAVFSAAGAASLGDRLGPWLTPCTPGYSPRDVAVLDDGRLVVWCSDEHVVTYLNDAEVARVHAAVMPALRGVTRFDALGDDLLAVGTVSGRFGVVDLASGQVLTAQDSALGMVRSLAAAAGADGPRVLASGPHGATVYLPRQNRLVPLESEPGALGRGPFEVVRQARAGGDDGLRLGSTGAAAGADRARWWHLGQTPAVFSSLSGLHGRSALAVPLGGTRLAIGDGNGRVEWFDLATGRSQAIAGPHRVVKALAWPVDGRYLAVGGAGVEGVAVVDTASGRPMPGPWVGEIDLRGRHLAWLAPNLLIAFAWGGGPYAWRIRPEGGQVVAVPTLPQLEPEAPLDVKDIAASGQGVWVLYEPGLLARLELRGQAIHLQTLGKVAGGKVLAVRPDGDRAYVVAGESVVPLDGQGTAGRPLHRPGAAIQDAALASDGRLALCRRDGSVSLEDAAGTPLWTAPAHTDRCAAVAFCDREQALCTAGWDGRVRVFAAPSLGVP